MKKTAKTYNFQACFEYRANSQGQHQLISSCFIFFSSNGCRIQVLCVFVWIQAHSLTERIHDIDLLSLDAQSVAEVVQ